MAAPHAFLDILANPQVRDAYLAGRISIILSADLGTILWTNGAGARFMGFRTVAESINVGSGFDRLTCHQVEAGLSGMRPVRIRGIPQAQSFLVNAILIEQLGQVIFLRSAVPAVAENGVVDLTDGLSDETTQAAVLDLSGRVVSASPDFDPYLFAKEELSALLQEAYRDVGVKKRFLAENENRPVGVLKLSDEPVIFLLIAAKSSMHENKTAAEQKFVFKPHKLPLRFVWKIDAEGRFTEVSPELEEVVGHKYADIIGLSFADLAADWKMDRDGAVRVLLRSYNAWSGRSLDWPVEDEKTRVSVELAALPVYSPDRVFSGLRGFGVINAVVKPEAADMADTGKTVAGGLSPQEHEAFSTIARHLRADILAVGEGQEPAPVVGDNFGENDAGVRNIAAWPIETAENDRQEGNDMPPLDKLFPLNQLPVAVLVYRDARALFINQAFLDMVGYFSADAFRQAGVLTDVLDEWIPRNIIRMASGDIVPVDISVRQIAWEDGRLAYMASFIRATADGPQRAGKTEMEALEYKSGQLAALLNMVSDGIIILDSAGIVASANETAVRMFGFSSGHMNGQLFSRFFTEKSLEVIRLGFHAAKQEGRRLVAGEGQEVEGMTARGDVLKLRVNFGRMELDDSYFLMVRDMTRFHAIIANLIRERGQAEEALQKKARYLALVSHEIRTPINAVIGLSQLMLEEKSEPLLNNRYRDYLGDIVRSGEHIMTLLNDLLQVSKSEEDQVKLDVKPVSLPVILNEVLGLMMPQANASRVIIRSGVSDDLPSITADARSVKQILLNLLSNAIRFTPQDGQIVISAYHHRQPNEVLLRIRDTGVGMSQMELQEAMQPYRQIKRKDMPANKSAAEGTGLGLPLTRAMAEANNARFTMHSRPGKGTIAEITFMVAAQRPAAS